MDVRKLSDQLACLGIGKPSAVAIDPSPAEEIAAIVRAVCEVKYADVDIGRNRALDEAVEVFAALELGMLRLGAQLTKAGVKLVEASYRHDFERDRVCGHDRVQVDEALSVLRCAICGASVNPTWWIAKRTREIERSEEWKLHLEHDKKQLAVEIDELKYERSKIKQQVKRAKTPKTPKGSP